MKCSSSTDCIFPAVRDGYCRTHARGIVVPLKVVESPPASFSSTRLRSTSLADIKPASIPWFWRHRIPAGALTVLYAPPGVGKGTLTAALAAATTTGTALPKDDQKRAPARVLFVVAEDDGATVLRPRLDAAGADVSRVHLFARDMGIRIPRHASDIESEVRELGAVLVVVDPLRAFLNGDSKRQVRDGLAALADVAARTGAAVVVVHHTNRQGGILGSQDIVGIPRSLLFVDSEGRELIITQAKKNLAPDAEPVRFRIVDKDGVGAVEWVEEEKAEASGVVEDAAERMPFEVAQEANYPSQSALEAVVALLATAGQPRHAASIIAELVPKGYAKATVSKAFTLGTQAGQIVRLGYGLYCALGARESAEASAFEQEGGEAEQEPVKVEQEAGKLELIGDDEPFDDGALARGMAAIERARAEFAVVGEPPPVPEQVERVAIAAPTTAPTLVPIEADVVAPSTKTAVSVQEKSCNRKLSPVEITDTGRKDGFRYNATPLAPFCSTTYASIQVTCPDSCAFKRVADQPNGCFADAGMTRMQMKKLDARGQGRTAVEVIRDEVRAIDGMFRGGRVPEDGAKGGRDLRIHIGGDAPTPECAALLGAAAGRWRDRGGGDVWTYTHAWREVRREVWSQERGAGALSVLASIENPADAELARAQGYQPAIVVDKFPNGPRVFEEAGQKYVPCPAEVSEKVTCVKCRLCLDDGTLRERGLGIAFAVHGQHHNEARAQLVQIRTPGAPKPEWVPQNFKCGNCGERGHKRQRCDKKDREAKAEIESVSKIELEADTKVDDSDTVLSEEAVATEQEVVEIEHEPAQSRGFRPRVADDESDSTPRGEERPEVDHIALAMPQKRRPRRTLTSEQLAALPRCSCCNRTKPSGPSKNCLDCMFCKQDGKKWVSAAMCPKTRVKTLRPVSVKQVVAEMQSKVKKTSAEQDRQMKNFRPKYEPF